MNGVGLSKHPLDVPLPPGEHEQPRTGGVVALGDDGEDGIAEEDPHRGGLQKGWGVCGDSVHDAISHLGWAGANDNRWPGEEIKMPSQA
jgi:hypothetical protein